MSDIPKPDDGLFDKMIDRVLTYRPNKDKAKVSAPKKKRVVKPASLAAKKVETP
jgi:hypothetical protein